MTLLQAVVLGIVQGVTEFLPISSSAHLILTSKLLGWPDQGLRFDMAANTGSLLALAVAFRREWARLLGSVARLDADPVARRRAWMVAAATVPVAVAGVLSQEWLAGSARSVGLIATTSIGFGVLLGWADRSGRGERRPSDLGWRGVMAIGLAQALALVPGTSRSGVTITAGLLAGLDRRSAARFSFVLALPVGILVAVKDLLDMARGVADETPLLPVAVGFAVSAISAYLTIRWLLDWLRRRDMLIFVLYRVAIGVVLLLFALD